MRRNREGWRDRTEEDVAEELGHYVELRARELEAGGLSPAEARREAERRFGDRSRIEETCVRIQRRAERRERRRLSMTGWRSDVVQAFRGLVRTPLVTVAALVTLALGIGANTAVFSVVRGVLLRPLPFADPGALVRVQETRPPGRTTRSVSPADYLDWRERSRALASLAAYTRRSANLVEGERPVRIGVGLVSGNFFATLGVSAELGRVFEPTLRIDKGIRQVVLGHALWQTRFGGDREVIGRTVRLDADEWEVIGIAPAGFDYPEGVSLWLRNPEEAPGIPGFTGELTQLRGAWYFDVVGRLAPGVTLAAAQSELDAIAASLRDEHPKESEGAGVLASPLREEIVGESRPLLLLLLSAVGLVLLAACANVANLSLVRAEGRRRDFAVRAALGAEGGRLLRFVLIEGLVLALAGGVLGAALAFLALPGLRAMLPASLPRRGAIALDGTVLLFTFGASLLACLLFAAAPALLARRTAPARALAGRAGDESGRAGAWLRAGLVVIEVALGVVLAAGTGLVIRSLSAMAHVEPGFRAEGLATAHVSFPDALTSSERERTLRWRQVRDAIAALPGVREAGVGIASPVERGPQAGLNVVRGDRSGIDAERSVVWHPATPGYLEALGVRLLRGRSIEETDRADGVPVAVVTEGLAREFFPDEDPIGQTVTIGLDEGHHVRIEIVGVVADTRNRGPVEAPTPILYRPLAQAGDFGGSAMTVAAHGPGDARALLRSIADAVHRVEPTAVVYDETIGSDLGAAFFAQHRFIFRLLALFAALAVTLAAVGIYGVTAHSISRRRRELGIRMAIGATRERVLASVFGSGLRLTTAGVVLGIVLALVVGRLLTSFLFRVRPADPLTLGAVSFLLLVVAALALALPARQAVRVDPAESMRGQ